MEADLGTKLVNNSSILQKSNLQVKIVIEDRDSSTIAAIRRDTNLHIFKFADTFHLKKNFLSDLYSLKQKHPQLNSAGVIQHIVRCFAYAVTQNHGNCDSLVETLLSIPNHLYDRHETCKSWCQTELKRSQTVSLENESLYTSLLGVFAKYAQNATKIFSSVTKR